MLIAPSLEVHASVKWQTLTAKQSRLLAFIVLYLKKNQIPPSVREMMVYMNHHSTAPTHSLLKALFQMRILGRTEKEARNIRILAPVQLDYFPVLYRIKLRDGFLLSKSNQATREDDRAQLFATRELANQKINRLRAVGVKSSMWVESVEVTEEEPCLV